MKKTKRKFWGVRRKYVIGSIIGLISLVALIYSANASQRNENLFLTPAPLPPYLSGLAPFPGSTLPHDEFSHPYWFPVRERAGLCVRIDARLLSSYLSAVEQPPFDKADIAISHIDNEQVQLFINNSPVDKTITRVLIGSTPYETLYISSSVSNASTQIPITYCWNTNFVSGSYTAKLVIETYLYDVLQYEWAFRVQ